MNQPPTHGPLTEANNEVGQPQEQEPPQLPSQPLPPQPPNMQYPQQLGYGQPPMQPGMYLPPQPPNMQYPQQLGYGQPPMQPGMYLPPQPPKKKSKLWLWITLGIIGVLVLFGSLGKVPQSSSTSTANSTPVDTAQPANTPQTTGQIAKVGQTITLQNIAATFISVKQLPDDQYIPASPGNMYIVVYVKLVNKSSGEVDYNEFDFHVKSGSGNITTGTFTSSYTANNQLNSGKLSPGGSVEGDIVFQTGKSDHKAQLTWQPSFFGNAGENGWLLGL